MTSIAPASSNADAHQYGMLFAFAAGVLLSTVGLGIRLIEDAAILADTALSVDQLVAVFVDTQSNAIRRKPLCSGPLYRLAIHHRGAATVCAPYKPEDLSNFSTLLRRNIGVQKKNPMRQNKESSTSHSSHRDRGAQFAN